MKGKRQVLGSWFKAVACGGVMLGALSAGAADFSVGRVDIRFAEEGWKEVALPDQSQAYGGEKDGALAPQVLDMQTAGVVSVRRPVYTVWSRHAISTGSFVDVRVFVTSPLGAEGASVPETLPGGVLPANVAWGRQLKDAVKSSVHSLSGRLVVPAIRPTAQTSGVAVSGG